MIKFMIIISEKKKNNHIYTPAIIISPFVAAAVKNTIVSVTSPHTTPRPNAQATHAYLLSPPLLVN